MKQWIVWHDNGIPGRMGYSLYDSEQEANDFVSAAESYGIKVYEFYEV